jgi:hypothetical protein
MIFRGRKILKNKLQNFPFPWIIFRGHKTIIIPCQLGWNNRKLHQKAFRIRYNHLFTICPERLTQLLPPTHLVTMQAKFLLIRIAFLRNLCYSLTILGALLVMRRKTRTPAPLLEASHQLKTLPCQILVLSQSLRPGIITSIASRGASVTLLYRLRWPLPQHPPMSQQQSWIP